MLSTKCIPVIGVHLHIKDPYAERGLALTIVISIALVTCSRKCFLQHTRPSTPTRSQTTVLAFSLYNRSGIERNAESLRKESTHAAAYAAAPIPPRLQFDYRGNCNTVQRVYNILR